jgi:plastocyanin
MRTLFVLAALTSSAPALAGGIRGIVKLDGAAPALAPLATNRDQGVCGKSVADESIVVKDGKLQNVVLTVKGAPAPTPKAEAVKVVLDQSQCRYVPHVQAATVGTPVDIVNSDPVLHNSHGFAGTATAFNLAMPLKGQKIEKKLSKPGVVSVKCDVHPWMQAYIVVTAAPSAVTGEDGAYTIKDVPAGTYTISAWHEKLGEKTTQVTVPETGEVTVDLSFAAK